MRFTITTAAPVPLTDRWYARQYRAIARDLETGKLKHVPWTVSKELVTVEEAALFFYLRAEEMDHADD
jgi:hypothetical protein